MDGHHDTTATPAARSTESGSPSAQGRPWLKVWVAIGAVALAVYAVFPAVMLSVSFESPDETTLWFNAVWLVPSALVLAGLVVVARRRRAGAALVLAGSLLLIPCTLFYFMMTLAVWMVASQVTLVAAGILGLISHRRAAGRRVRWALLLAVPMVVGLVGAGVWWFTPGLGTGAQGVEFPLAGGIRYELAGPGSEQVVAPEALDSSSGSQADAGPAFQFAGVEELPWETRGSFETSVADAVHAQRAALEREGWSVSVGPLEGTGLVMTARKDGHQATITFERSIEAGAGDGGTLVVRVEEL